MNTKRLIKSGVLAMLFLTLAVSLAFAQAPLSTAFTYQGQLKSCLLYTSPSPRDRTRSRMPSSA